MLILSAGFVALWLIAAGLFRASGRGGARWLGEGRATFAKTDEVERLARKIPSALSASAGSNVTTVARLRGAGSAQGAGRAARGSHA